MHARKGQSHPFEKSRLLQRQLYLAAKKSRNRRFHALYDRICRPDILWRAFEEVKANGGAAGVDGLTLEQVESQGTQVFLQRLEKELRQGTYHPRPVRRVYIPKADGKKRPLGIPTVKDRVVQQACKIVLEPLFEASFLECSYGFRPKRNAHQAVERVRKAMVGYWWAVDADIQSFFDTLDHGLLLTLVEKRVSDRKVLKLIRGWLKAGVLEGGQVAGTEEGTPQGGVISPLLANIYLHVLDMLWHRDYGHLGTLVRYADDLVIVCKYRIHAQKALAALQGILRRLKLTLHPVKTRLVHLEKEGFDFLGFHFRRIKSRWSGKLYPSLWPSQKAMNAIRQKLREATERRWVRVELERITKRLAPVIRGWRGYFGIGNATRKLQQLDDYLRYRLWKLHKKRLGRNGRKKSLERFLEWEKRFTYDPFFKTGRCGRAL